VLLLLGLSMGDTGWGGMMGDSCGWSASEELMFCRAVSGLGANFKL
jgi:hypothetical protein